mgnify:CR=1 FL=1|jgi:hypothetical protein
MKTKVIPFVPTVTDVNPGAAAASQLQQLIEENVNEGWNFINLTSMQTTVNPTGCSSAGKNNAQSVNIQLLIFSK